jgi:hypothetical protein
MRVGQSEEGEGAGPVTLARIEMGRDAPGP